MTVEMDCSNGDKRLIPDKFINTYILCTNHNCQARDLHEHKVKTSINKAFLCGIFMGIFKRLSNHINLNITKHNYV